MSSTNEINEYLIRLRNGEPCLEEFFRATSGYIKVIAYKYLIDKSFVNDVVTITFYKIFDNIHRFDERQNGKSWISKIAQNEAYTINNREKKYNHESLDEISEEIACALDYPSRVEFVAALQNALTKLGETNRIIVEQRIIEGKTFKEIAEMLGMYVGTVYKRFKKSVKKINNEIL
ncbi:MAG: sigma-70 family RNA polymerase sigma factor [Clostridiales bacterium]|nr:sigma-70 family RNA polymerase sigma factor [Clostridiales bacterium]